VLSEYASAKVTLINLFKSKKGILQLEASGLIQEVSKCFQSLSSLPTLEHFAVTHGMWDHQQISSFKLIQSAQKAKYFQHQVKTVLGQFHPLFYFGMGAVLCGVSVYLWSRYKQNYSP
jgi:hypothetical protein